MKLAGLYTGESPLEFHCPEATAQRDLLRKEGQGTLGRSKEWEKLLRYLPDVKCHTAVGQGVSGSQSSEGSSGLRVFKVWGFSCLWLGDVSTVLWAT